MKSLSLVASSEGLNETPPVEEYAYFSQICIFLIYKIYVNSIMHDLCMSIPKMLERYRKDRQKETKSRRKYVEFRRDMKNRTVLHIVIFSYWNDRGFSFFLGFYA